MTCEEALRLLYEVIDKEASDYDVKRVEEHLHKCKDCMSRYQFEEMFKAFVVDKASTKSKSDQLKSSILRTIEVSRRHPRRAQGGRFRFSLVIAAAAVALIFCFVAAFSAAKFYRHKVYVYPFEKMHMDSSAGNIGASALSISDVVTARNYLANDMHYNFNGGVAGFSLVGAGIKEMFGHRFVYLRYLTGDDYISLFIGMADEINLPDFERVVASGTEYFKHVCRDCQAIYWIRNNTITIAVTENKNIDLTALVPFKESI
ncbi:MAG: zf-HC2 domain-containing protein [Candidatus Zixiibacteriota bacterium]